VALPEGGRPGPELGSRSSRILGGGEGARSWAIAAVSTALFFGLLALVISRAPNWPRVRESFFSGEQFRESLPDVANAFLTNVKLFCIVEVVVLASALLVAVLRGLPGPAFLPVRACAIAYTDLFRGIPTIIVVYMLGFGVPGLVIPGVPNDPFFWGAVSLALVYTAYVAEVYRAGIESVHPSQGAAARSLGLTHLQALRFVIIPQAVRRIVPPLLNDFIGLQKDTALVALIGVTETFRQSQIESAASFNYTPYVASAILFVLITIPLARFTDWLILRNRRRELARA
jgi:polar amino acid transport system permease protein